MTEPAPELEEALAQFRQEWREEAERKRTELRAPPAAAAAAAAEPAAPASSSSSSPPIPSQSRAIVAGLEDLRIEEADEPVRPRTAVEEYQLAVDAERGGQLNEALKHYRQAFKLDSDVDKAWYRRTALTKSPPRRPAEPLPSTSSSSPPAADGETFRFQRTLQYHPDYESGKEHRSVQAVEAGLGKHAAARPTAGDDATHPSSTSFLRTSLARSFAANPYVPPESSAAPPPSTPTTSADFLQADPEGPIPFGALPHEVLILILKQLTFSSVTPPPKPTDPSLMPAAPIARGKVKRKPPKEEKFLLELELGLEEPELGWKSDVEALERFAASSRAARILTLDDGLWRQLCLRTYVPPSQIDISENALQIARDQHGGDFRRCYIEHPRLRLDGAYIAVVTYVRKGDSSTACLRFYPSGLVVSLLTVEAPDGVVRTLNPSLRVKGVMFGTWRLRDDIVDCWGLEDPNIVEASRKYSFRMQLRLKSTARGRMNKLEMLSLATEDRRSLELEEVPIRPTKPFFFSKVAAYAGDE
ncbi:hypothetical protein RQP46_003402 [Phenoliferia psychrophenolica]